MTIDPDAAEHAIRAAFQRTLGEYGYMAPVIAKTDAAPAPDPKSERVEKLAVPSAGPSLRTTAAPFVYVAPDAPGAVSVAPETPPS